MKTLTLFCRLASTAGMLGLCGLAHNVSAEPAMEIFKDQEFHFSLHKPSAWRVVASAVREGKTVRLRAPGEPMLGCAVTVADLPFSFPQESINANTLADRWTPETWQNMLGKEFPEAQVVSHETTSLAAQPAHAAVIESTSGTGVLKRYEKQRIVLLNTPGKTWNLRCLAAAATPLQAQQAYADAEPTFRAVLQSFALDQP